MENKQSNHEEPHAIPSTNDPSAKLVVFDKLEVGPIKVERQRLVAPYRIFQNGKEDGTELIYSFDEEVFDPFEAESLNLASLMAAQVALNYGLFCQTIVFHGMFDGLDRRFLRNMAENTAREIYVKKFLEPNPFLVEEVEHLPPEKQSKYLKADLRFPQAVSARTKAKWKLWSSDKNRHCILSSGGKDSLLSYGLVNEIIDANGETHPIFVNESGRHWFTALNAYRYFKDNIPHTARVWVNSDRIFSWMLKHMPFIRKNFADIRSDEYPIRLWTVAVFLFGVLPIVRKRGIGRLIIGDEFDTSQRSSFNGINHFDGLYDQSIYFDQVLSRYFLQKGWAISQFSILRSLSELLIEKILVERYPHLQTLQMSCHATHKEADGIHPCGKCEKCRRIVGMLLALDADPKGCGYTERQVKDCLEKLTTKGVHQEQAGAEQLFFMLTQRNLLNLSSSCRTEGKERPEILKLRFDFDKSPVNAIPMDLRKPLYHILIEYAEGAIRRQGKKWLEYDVLADLAFFKPYPYEIEPLNIEEGRNGLKSYTDHSYLWGELTWSDAAERFKQVDIALLPVGAIEQHGPHLPLDTDAFDAQHLASRVAEACSDPKPIVLPLISYGVSYHHDDFNGTISISNETLSRLVYEIGMSVAKNGIRKLVILNAHGGNGPPLNYAAQMINRDARIFVCVDTGETSDVDVYNLTATPNDVHAGEIETSTALAVRPHLVKMERALKSIPEFSSRYLNFTSKRGISWYAYTRKISATGIMGDPTKADAKKGERIWEIMIAHLVAFVEDLKHMSLEEEIYHRKY
jgi:creatinine amidohydrolase/Fe(II)-dependent formamide hydrolase-like protein